MKTLALLLLSFSLIAYAQPNGVLIVGDSWAEEQLDDEVHDSVFTDYGYANVNIIGDTTAISGSEASDWVEEDQLEIIAQALSLNPQINTIQLTIGGNDFLNNWSINMTSKEEMELQQQIQVDITTIIDFILAQDATIEIVLSFYDYPNFEDTIGGFTGIVCNSLLTDLGRPSTALLNSKVVEFESVYSEIAANNPRVYHVSHLGLMQNFYDGISLPGDTSLPSPIDSLRVRLFGALDCFHLNALSYEVLVENLFNGYFHTRFDTVFKASFD